MSRAAAVALAAALAWSAVARAGEAVPAWLDDAAARPSPAWVGTATTLVLERAHEIEIPARGRVVERHREAMRVLHPDGVVLAFAELPYARDGTSIRSFRAWRRDAAGRVEALGPRDAVDATVDASALYTERRVQRLIPAGAGVGDVFGYEYEVEVESFVAGWIVPFRDSRPTLHTRIAFVDARGAPPVARVLGGAEPVVTSEGARRSWEFTDLHPVPAEPFAPDPAAILPAVAIQLAGADGADTPAGTVLADWRSISRWYGRLSEDAARLDPELAAEAGRLAGSGAAQADRIAALARAAQSVPYAHVALNLSRGGGMRPRAAAVVMRQGFGDCKDKANLLRTMLRAIDVPSWLVLINASDAALACADAPSTDVFDHCILALPAPAGSAASSTVDHPALGRLLLFDPTDSRTPFGRLPSADRGRLALVVAGDSGALVRTPDAAPETERRDWGVRGALTDAGTLEGNFHERDAGEPALVRRLTRERGGTPALVRVLERSLAAPLGSAAFSEIETPGATDSLAFEIRGRLRVQGAARRVGREQRVLTLGPLPVDLLPAPDRRPRTLPVRLGPGVRTERWDVALPAGWSVAALPPAARDSTDFAVLESSWSRDSLGLSFSRRLTVHAATIAPGRWPEMQSLLRRARDATLATVMLAAPPGASE